MGPVSALKSERKELDIKNLSQDYIKMSFRSELPKTIQLRCQKIDLWGPHHAQIDSIKWDFVQLFHGFIPNHSHIVHVFNNNDKNI